MNEWIDLALALSLAAVGALALWMAHRTKWRGYAASSKRDRCPHCGGRDLAPLHYGGENPVQVCRGCWRRA